MKRIASQRSSAPLPSPKRLPPPKCRKHKEAKPCRTCGECVKCCRYERGDI